MITRTSSSLFFATFFIILGCDSSSILIGQNQTDYDVIVEVKVKPNYKIYFDRIPMTDSLFEKRVNTKSFNQSIAIVETDSLNYSFILPARSSVLVSPSTLGRTPPIDQVILTIDSKKDTINFDGKNINLSKNIRLWRTGFMGSDVVLNIH